MKYFPKNMKRKLANISVYPDIFKCGLLKGSALVFLLYLHIFEGFEIETFRPA